MKNITNILFIYLFFFMLSILAWIDYFISYTHRPLLFLIPAIISTVFAIICYFCAYFSYLPTSIFFTFFMITIFSYLFMFLDQEELYKTGVISSILFCSLITVYILYKFYIYT